MSIIYYDGLSIEKSIADKLNSAISYSNEILSLCNYMSIPYDFKYRDYLNSFDDKMRKSLKTMNSVQKKISTSKLLYEQNEGSIETEIQVIESDIIQKRNTAI